MNPIATYNIRTKQDNRQTLIAMTALIGLAIIVSAGRFLEDGFVGTDDIAGIIVASLIFSVIPISIFLSTRKAWNKIEVYDDKFILHSRVHTLEFQRHLLKTVRTHRVAKTAGEQGVVRISSPIKDQTLTIKLGRTGGPEVFKWFQALEVEQTGESNPDKLEGPTQTIRHAGYSNTLYIWELIRHWAAILIIGGFAFGVILGGVYFKDAELIKEFFLEISLCIIVAFALVRSRKHFSNNSVMEVEITEHRLILKRRNGDQVSVPMNAIRRITKGKRREYGIDTLETYHIFADNGAWVIYIRSGLSGQKELKAWLKSAEGEHTL